MAGRPSLRVTHGPAAGTTIPLDQEPFVIGRGESELGRLGDDPELSRRHASISERDGDLTIEDLGSRNGTFVNGRRIAETAVLRPGDEVELGGTKLTVERAQPDVTAKRPAEPPPPVSAAPRAILKVASGPAAGTRVPLGDAPFTIGRAESEQGKLGDDPELSRRHAQISLADGELAVDDLGSTNGTFVNGRRIAYPTLIRPGDSIEVGSTTLEVLEGPAARPSRVSQAAVSAVQRVRGAETGLLARLANLVQSRPRQVLAGTGVFFVVAVVFGGPTVGLLESHPQPDPNVESTLAKERLEKATGTQLGVGMIALVRTGEPVNTQAARRKVQRVIDTIERDKDVARTIDFYSTREQALVSRDRRSTYVSVVFKRIGDAAQGDAATRVAESLDGQRGVQTGGEGLTGPTVGEQIGEDLGKAERLAFPLLFIVSLFVFRGAVAALLPLFVGIITIFTTFLLLRIINSAIADISLFALNMVIALGLGLAIDYSLFIVSRYREELADTGPGLEAITRTLQTAGRTIIFSALTVAAALASLLVFPQGFLRSMGIGGALCALVALTVALVALPALLALLGPRVNAGAPERWKQAAQRTARREESGFWYRLSRTVMRRPAAIAAASAAFLILLGLPFLGINFNGFDASVLPKGSEVRAVDTALKSEFPTNRGRQINIAVEAPASASRQVQDYASSLERLRGVAAVEKPRPLAGGVWQANVIPRFGDIDERTLDLVDEIRNRGGPFPISVAGTSAAFIDQQSSLGSHLPLALTLLVVWTLVILFALTGSLILPLKSILMNVLTVSAAFGLLVLIFQDGRLEGVLGFESNGGIETTQPLLLFALAFGLSTDYAVFLLTRIKEAREAGESEEDAVAIGLERTGRIVTAAALLFTIAVGAFATSQIIFIKEVGVGTALAVIIDATIVRALLVPSLMALLGRRNWWAPGPLRRLHNRFGISES